MTNHAELIDIADAISETDPALACRLRALAARVRSQERCLDELVEDSRLSARMAESVAVEHLSRYRRKANPPYPFCRTPAACDGKGYCPKEVACNE